MNQDHHSGLNFPSRFPFETVFDNRSNEENIRFILDYLAPYGQVHHYRKNEIVSEMRQGDFLVVLRGEFNASILSDSGETQILYRLERGSVEGEGEHFMLTDALIFFQALGSAELSIIPAEIAEKRMERQPELMVHLMQMLLRKRNLLLFTLSDICFNDALGRLTSFLLRQIYLRRMMSKSEPSSSYGYYIGNYTHQELASRLQLNRVTVTRMLAELREEGLIAVNGRKIFVVSPEGLQKKSNLLKIQPSKGEKETAPQEFPEAEDFF